MNKELICKFAISKEKIEYVIKVIAQANIDHAENGLKELIK